MKSPDPQWPGPRAECETSGLAGILAASHPILTCADARAFEARLFGGDEAREWPAMQRAGRALAEALLRDFEEVGGFPATGSVLILAGKGHNGGDALIAAQAILERHPAARAQVRFVFGERALRPLARRAWRGLMQTAGRRTSVLLPGGAAGAPEIPPGRCDLCLDGVFGFQFHPPAEPRVAALLARVNAAPIRLRAAVDLPSAGIFRADFTYATGSVKAPVIAAAAAGRVRYLDLGFFEPPAGAGVDPRSRVPGAGHPAARDRVLLPGVLGSLAGWRDPRSDKRSHGHLLVIGGSSHFPGAVLMTVLAALRSGVGLVTAFVPTSLAAAFAARAPEAMWVGWPETARGGLARKGERLLRERIERATALVIGPGMGREAETLALIRRVVGTSTVPCVLDADALQPAIVRAGKAPRILTPHAGEFERIAGGATLRALAAETGATVVLKGPVTRIASGAGLAPGPGRKKGGLKPGPSREICVYHSFFGGPVLARGGSGDLLAGLTGGVLAQIPDDPLLAAARGVVWHGLAADGLARAHGPVAVHATQLLDFLAPALRELH